MTVPPPAPTPQITVHRLSAFEGSDVNDICDAAEAAVVDGGGFGWLKAPPRHVFEAYWRGVLLVPERMLFVGRLDGVIAGSAQLVRPPRNNEAQAHAAILTGAFVAPWARGHGLARGLTAAVEDAARAAGFRVLNLDVRETQTPAIAMYEARGFVRWGTHPRYALVDGSYIAGYFYTMEL
jgi:ribosomal protein S18 acetylase RimI-like enzyme